MVIEWTGKRQRGEGSEAGVRTHPRGVLKKNKNEETEGCEKKEMGKIISAEDGQMHKENETVSHGD